MTAAPRTFPAARIIRPETATSPRRMGAMLTAGAAILAVVLSTAVPAQAAPDSEDMLKTLLGLAIIGAIANEANKDNKKPRYTDDDYYPAPSKPHKKKKGYTVPASCAIQISGKKRDAVVYSESCMLRAGVNRNLPYNCSNEAKIYGRWDTIFSEQCLRNAGFRLGR